MTATRTTPVNPVVRLDRYGYNCIARHLFLAVMTGGLIFLGAGTLEWTHAWLFSSVYFLCWLSLSLVLVRWNPELLNERGKPAAKMTGTKSWDWLLVGLYALLIVVQPFSAGVDFRYRWSADGTLILALIGNLLMIVAMALLTWSMVHNRFFEGTVRLQEQRGQSVISSGPYQYVRHPGYTAVMLTFLALPVALGTWLALIPGLIGIVVFVIRTALEDRTLQTELPGYVEFTQTTRYRLIPGVW